MKIDPCLVQNPLFRGLPEHDLPAVLTALAAKTARFGKSEAILAEGSPAHFCGIVCEGAVQVTRQDAFGNRTVVGHIAPPDLFGETFAWAETGSLPVSVVAVLPTTATLLRLRRLTTHTVPHGDALKTNLLDVLTAKNLYLNSRLDVLSRRTTREKLLAYLSEQAQATGSRSFDISLDRQALADLLCVERSAMSAELSKMQKEGILHTTRSRFTLL